jgi:hypothetical protein
VSRAPLPSSSLPLPPSTSKPTNLGESCSAASVPPPLRHSTPLKHAATPLSLSVPSPLLQP